VSAQHKEAEECWGWELLDWAERLANRQALRARDTNGGHWNGRLSGRQWLQKVAELDNRCYWCGTRLPVRDLTVDHLWPLSRPGATNNIWSCVPACRRCNSMRGNQTPEAFMRWLVAQETEHAA
jgi:5-methylcytosine-specific restriction endonuclease McrA